MDTEILTTNDYTEIADQYADSMRRTDATVFSWNHDLVIPVLLKVVGDVSGLTVLDAGCGEGIVARYLAEKGAHVVAIDIAPRFIELAQAHRTHSQITYLVHNLSQALPQYQQTFDLVVSNLVLNDVPDYVGFANTLGSVTKTEGRLVLSFTNPYSAVFREKVDSYFDSGEASPYDWGNGTVYHFHRTMEDYITAFRNAGFLLRTLSDVHVDVAMVARLPKTNRTPWFQLYHRFPFFVILEFVRQ